MEGKGEREGQRGGRERIQTFNHTESQGLQVRIMEITYGAQKTQDKSWIRIIG